MGNTIQKCKLFLALGEEQELQDGYGKIGAYIHRLNRTYRANELQLQLIPYGAKEGSFLSGGAAVDVHKEVQDCEIALFLFYRDVPKALKEELQEVYALFQKTSKPKILTFFRLEEGAAAVGVGDRLEKLLDYIGSDIRHYYNVYSHIDSVTLALVTHMAELGWVHGPRMVNGNILLPGGEVIDSSHLEVFRNNRELQELREQWRKHSVQPGSREEQELLQKISSLESSILQDMMKMFRELVGGSTISARRQAAYRAFAQGDYADVQTILDHEKVVEKMAVGNEMIDVGKDVLQECVEELLLLVRSLRAGGEKDEAKIVERYEEIYQLIRERQLDPAPLYEYAEYLYNKNDFVHAREVGETYRKRDIDVSEEDKAKLLTLMGIINSEIADEKALEYVERDYKDALKIWEGLAQRLPEIYEIELAWFYKRIGEFFGSRNQYEEKVDCYKKSIDICKYLEKEQPKVYKMALIISYYDLGCVYGEMGHIKEEMECIQNALECYQYLKGQSITDMPKLKQAVKHESSSEIIARLFDRWGVCCWQVDRRKEAEKYLFSALNIRKSLATEKPEIYEGGLAASYNHLGNFYADDVNKPFMAWGFFCEAQKIFDELCKKEAKIYGPALFQNYWELGAFYCKIGRYKAAEKCYQESLKIYKRLEGIQLLDAESALAGLYNSFGNLYRKDGIHHNEAAKYYQKALKIYKRLAEARPARYNGDLATVYRNLGNLCSDDSTNSEAAERFYQKALELYEYLFSTFPDRYEPGLAGIYSELGLYYHDNGRRKEAWPFLRKALDIRKRLALINPEKYESALAISYNDMGIFYGGEGRSEYAEEYLQKAKDIFKRLAIIEPRIYKGFLAGVYRNLIKLYRQEGYHNKITECMLQALETDKCLAQKWPKIYESALMSSYNKLGAYYSENGCRKEAEECYQKSLEICERLAQAQPAVHEPNLANIYKNLGLVYQKDGRRQEAEENFAQAYALAQKYRSVNADCALICIQLKRLLGK